LGFAPQILFPCRTPLLTLKHPMPKPSSNCWNTQFGFQFGKNPNNIFTL
jgi:hypothetical protein